MAAQTSHGQGSVGPPHSASDQIRTTKYLQIIDPDVPTGITWPLAGGALIERGPFGSSPTLPPFDAPTARPSGDFTSLTPPPPTEPFVAVPNSIPAPGPLVVMILSTAAAFSPRRRAGSNSNTALAPDGSARLG